MLRLLVGYLSVSFIDIFARNLSLTTDVITAIGLILLFQFLFFVPVLLVYYLILKFIYKNIQLRPWQQFSLGIVAGIVELIIPRFWSDPSLFFIMATTTGVIVTLSVSLSHSNQTKT